MRNLLTAALIACVATAAAIPTGAMAAASAAAAATAAAPDYVTIHMEIDVNKPAAEVWAKVGKYCDIAQWLSVDCKIVAGKGGIGTVRSLANGRVLEILVAQTNLSYGYTQPAKAGTFYNLYHGFLEAKPVTRSTSKLIYTLFYDVSDKPDEAAKQADIKQRRTRFEAALQKMKQIAEQ
jgi:Polyketide cyclase / dehydrase and lipid transport